MDPILTTVLVIIGCMVILGALAYVAIMIVLASKVRKTFRAVDKQMNIRTPLSQVDSFDHPFFKNHK